MRPNKSYISNNKDKSNRRNMSNSMDASKRRDTKATSGTETAEDIINSRDAYN